MKKQQGFTLIELMIVVAIIAILAAIALPAYQNYVARSQVTAGLADIRGGVTAFEEYVQRGSADDVDEDKIGLATSTPRCSSIAVVPGADGTITCTMVGNPSVNGKDVELARQSNDGSWQCTADVDAKFKPSGCQ
jgi:type IV pilus assembly protein PilA